MTDVEKDDLAGLSKRCKELERQVANMRDEIVDLKKDQWRLDAAMRQLLSRMLTLGGEPEAEP